MTATEGPFAHVLALNALAGTTTVTATKPGVVFAPVTLVVENGQVNTLTLVRGSVQ